MDGTAFVPGTYAGANRVAALVLPDAAKSIPAGDYSSPTFRAFTALASLSGAGVETLGESAFNGCTSLTEVSLPAATTIGAYAFYQCTSLTEVSLPAATTIGGSAFGDCTSLTEVSLPAATTIGSYAFSGTNLTTVSLPAVTSIGNSAFYYCESLTSVNLPATPPSISSIFYYTGYYSGDTITISVPAGVVFAYTSTWGVSANTPYGGNTSKYGNYHKAVLITDAVQ
jgi:hypothetical protein